MPKDWSAANQKKRKRKEGITLFRKWGTYDLGFNTLRNAGISELRAFIQRLDANSRWATTRPHTMEKLMNQPKRSALEVLNSVQREPFNDDLIIINDHGSLQEYLAQCFTKPLLYPSTLTHASHITWDDFWGYLQNNSKKKIDVYDYSILNESTRTQQRTVQKVIDHWAQPPHSRTPLNCLDIENRLGHCCPVPIITVNLLERALLHAEKSIGKTESTWSSSHAEFLVASTANAVSTIHTDSGGGLTFIKILHGRKIFYFPRRVDSSSIRLLAQVGAQHVKGYIDGWARVELQPGDLFIMPPLFPHAVFTPEDSLFAGGNFYTAAHLSSTLEAIRCQEDYPTISNEDLMDKHYETLTRVLKSFHLLGTPDEVKRVWGNCSLFTDKKDLSNMENFEGVGPREFFIQGLREFAIKAQASFKKERE
ncbi:hypothetical protein BJY01DRAFT_240262 [Aspergillus pseudoustus]|uniref:[histone H3]-dimethyl-L-lysine(36) demethylase n=1 Tax=Aspergillus pseudoustus TaxID=1810923 RepID=A0ABR4IT53_9EURO